MCYFIINKEHEMDQVISELIAQWGVFGLVVVLVGFIIYDKFKKPNQKELQVSGCAQGNIIYQSLAGIQNSIDTKFDGMKDSIDAINVKVECLDDKFETKIEVLENKIQKVA